MTFSNSDEKLCQIMGLYRGHFNTKMCLVFNCIIGAEVVPSIICRDRDRIPSSCFNGRSMVRGVVNSIDLALWWC
jgi:hypothetical protein